MFERYTEKARRIIFFARHEASEFGSPSIESEHLLLGFLRECHTPLARSLNAESIRDQIGKRTEIRQKIATSVDLPISNESSTSCITLPKKPTASGINTLARSTF